MAVICAAAELQFWDDLHDINEALAPNIAKVMFQSHAHSCLLLEVTIVLASQPMRPGTRKTSERLKRQREMNGLPNTQLAARKRTRQTSTPPLSRPLGSPSRRLRPMPSG